MAAPEPPEGWELYFPDQEFVQVGSFAPIDDLIEIGMDLLKPKVNALPRNELWRFKKVSIQHDEIDAALIECEHGDLLWTSPEIVINCFGLAAWSCLKTRCQSESLGVAPSTQPFFARQSRDGYEVPFGPIRKIYIRISCNNFRQFTPIRKLKFLEMHFLCTKCNADILIYVEDSRYRQPRKCTNCRSRSFSPSKQARTVDSQIVKLQEVLSDKEHELGRIPRTVEITLIDDLAQTAFPGDVVSISGIVKVVTLNEEGGRRRGMRGDRNAKSMFQLYVEANNISNDKSNRGMKAQAWAISEKDYPCIRTIAQEEDTFKLIVNSICPGIYGHENVKAGIALCLFGGRQRDAEDDSRLSRRGDCHVLIVGDPGLGKSQMLQAASAVAPRGIFVCGSCSSGSGLTVTLHREKGNPDYVVEAGALVLSDRGVCCIDEFDKMKHEHSSLLEAMEQQSVSIAKAGIVCSLPARTAVIAAANPTGGHYNRSKTVSENLKINRALLSRFDLIFILLDRADDSMDTMLRGSCSDHVMSLHKRGGGKNRSQRMMGSQGSQRPRPGLHAEERNCLELPLADRLKVDPGTFDFLPPAMLRKYIAYARKHVDPEFSHEASQILQDFYAELRQNHRGLDTTPITTRQHESLIRLAEARARIDLSPIVLPEHAREVVELMSESLMETCEDEYGNVDFTKGQGMSHSRDGKKFISFLRKEKQSSLVDHWTTDELREIASTRLGLDTTCFIDFLEMLNNHNLLLKHGHRKWRLGL